MPTSIINGAQWGDEGKGKIASLLASSHDISVRCNGGSNAEHSFVVANKTLKMRLAPVGIAYGNIGVITDNVYIGPDWLASDIEQLEQVCDSLQNKLWISHNVHVVMPDHRERDGQLDDKQLKIETIRQGIGPAVADRASRVGVNLKHYLKQQGQIDSYKAWDKAAYYVELLQRYATNTTAFLAQQLDKKILIEGAQGFMLDNTFGTYPYATSSHTTTAGLLHGAGIPYHQLSSNIGVIKAYVTRFSTGPFVSEANKESAQWLRDKGGEYSTYIKKPMRCGWLDLVALRYAHQLNHYTELAMNKLDILSGLDRIPVCVAYEYQGERYPVFYDWSDMDVEHIKPIYQYLSGWQEDIQGIKDFKQLPDQARAYIEFVEQQMGVPINIIGTGPAPEDTIIRNNSSGI